MSRISRKTVPWDEVFRLRRAGRLESALTSLEEEWGTPREHESPSLSALGASIRGELARVARMQGHLDRAGQLLRLALRDAPQFPDLHYQRGLVAGLQNDLRSSREAFEEALRLDTGYLAPALSLALLEAREGKLGDAIGSLEELSVRQPPRYETEFRQGMEKLREGSWEDAEPLLLKAFQQRMDEFDETRMRIGRLLDEGRTTEALSEAKRLAAESPDHADAHHAVGLACLGLDWWDDAMEAFGRALRVNADFHEARVYLAWVFYARGESGAAEAELDRVLARDPGFVSAQKLRSNRGAGRVHNPSQPQQENPAITSTDISEDPAN